MITPQDIREKGFDRAVRGYDMEAVDEFLDDLAVDYANALKEISSLKSKMRVCAEKIEEYRQTEDSMRLALLSAQKMSEQIKTEAQEKADQLVNEAQAKADNIKKEAETNIANELAKLNEAQKATQKYVDHMTAVCQKQIEFYAKLADAQLVAAPKAVEEAKSEETEDVEETVRSIGNSAAKAALEEPEEALDLEEVMDDEDDEPTRMFTADNAAQRRKRSRAEYTFDDE